MPKTQKKQNKWQQYWAEGRVRAQRYLARRPHRSFRLTDPVRYKKGRKVERLAPLIIGTFVTIWQEKRLLGVLTLLFATTTYMFVGGLSQLNFAELRQTTQELFEGNLGAFGTVTTLFTAAITGGLNPAANQLQQVLFTIIVFLFWLSLVWILRRRFANQHVTVREAIYNAGAPIVPTVIIFFFLLFQLIPAAIGLLGAALALSGAWLNGGVESMVVTVAAGLLCLLSIYWVSGSIMALIIVTIPGMYPWKAYSAASDLVIGQRWQIAIRLIMLGIVLFLLWAVVLVPALLLDEWLRVNWLPLIPVLVQLLMAFSFTYGATYLYKMYRSMI